MKRFLFMLCCCWAGSASAQFYQFEPAPPPVTFDGIEYIGEQTRDLSIVAIRGLHVGDEVYDVRFEYGTFAEFDAQGKMPFYHGNDPDAFVPIFNVLNLRSLGTVTINLRLQP